MSDDWESIGELVARIAGGLTGVAAPDTTDLQEGEGREPKPPAVGIDRPGSVLREEYSSIPTGKRPASPAGHEPEEGAGALATGMEGHAESTPAYRLFVLSRIGTAGMRMRREHPGGLRVVGGSATRFEIRETRSAARAHQRR